MISVDGDKTFCEACIKKNMPTVWKGIKNGKGLYVVELPEIHRTVVYTQIETGECLGCKWEREEPLMELKHAIDMQYRPLYEKSVPGSPEFHAYGIILNALTLPNPLEGIREKLRKLRISATNPKNEQEIRLHLQRRADLLIIFLREQEKQAA